MIEDCHNRPYLVPSCKGKVGDNQALSCFSRQIITFSKYPDHANQELKATSEPKGPVGCLQETGPRHDDSSRGQPCLNDTCNIKFVTRQGRFSPKEMDFPGYLSVSDAQLDEIAAALRASGVHYSWLMRAEAAS
ncbi:hypothetical protein RJ641_032716 [Dillenia turbinata]|uniref:Uncharacterized protein n=1 Tax=Dillenia turbinata TaxID=194707 RepID=A0AAN8ZF41_9MAGN